LSSKEGATSWGAYVPDLPRCVAVAERREEIEGLIADAIAFHSEGLREAGEPVPPPKYARCGG
jgi:predicted RNase H-like HicB family nuclease